MPRAKKIPAKNISRQILFVFSVDSFSQTAQSNTELNEKDSSILKSNVKPQI
jgi:hypothetical protein